ncbi:unnamed protein product, partial [Owenia fusiformis]
TFIAISHQFCSQAAVIMIATTSFPTFIAIISPIQHPAQVIPHAKFHKQLSNFLEHICWMVMVTIKPFKCVSCAFVGVAMVHPNVKIKADAGSSVSVKPDASTRIPVRRTKSGERRPQIGLVTSGTGDTSNYSKITGTSDQNENKPKKQTKRKSKDNDTGSSYQQMQEKEESEQRNAALF